MLDSGFLPQWAEIIALVVSGASAVAAATPTKSDDNILGKLFGIINLLALNVGKAQNADDKPSK